MYRNKSYVEISQNLHNVLTNIIFDSRSYRSLSLTKLEVQDFEFWPGGFQVLVG